MAYVAPTRFLQCRVTRCLILLLMSVSSAAFAQHSGCGQTVPVADSPVPDTETGLTSDTASGLRVYIDPQTGELLPEPPPGTPAAVDVAAAEPQPELPELVEEIQPDGSVMVRLDDRFQIPLQAELEGDQLVTCHGEQNRND